MTNTARMSWPFPNENQHPWYLAIKGFADAVDASGYAAREDRNLLVVGGGTVLWQAVGSTLQWSDPIRIISPVTGFLLSIEAATLTMDEGAVLYTTLVRAPSRSQAVPIAVSSTVASTDVDLVLAIRIGDRVYWRNGLVLDAGISVDGLGVVSSRDWQADFVDSGLYTLAASPVEEVVGQTVFDGSRVGVGSARFFGMLTPTFATTGTAYLRIYDMGPSAGPPEAASLISELSSTAGGGPQYEEQILTVAATKGTNQIMSEARMYEARAFMAGTTGDTVYVGGGGIGVR